MNKEVSLKNDLKTFNIDVDDIKLNPHFSEVLQEAIDKMRKETLTKNFEVILNTNLVEVRDKNTNYKTIIGCRVSYADLEESISFIVRPDEKPSYEYLEQQCKNQKEVIDKAINFIENGDLLYLANKNSIVYRNNIEVRAVADRLNDLLQILEDKEVSK